MVVSTKRTLLSIFTGATILFLAGCSSIMGHVAPYENYYPGVDHNITMLKDDNNGWLMRSLLVLDLPFTAVLDTALLPYDYYRSSGEKKSSRQRVSESDKKKQASGQMKNSGYRKSTPK